MNTIKKNFDRLKKLYNDGESPLEEIFETTLIILSKLSIEKSRPFGICNEKQYHIFEKGQNRSRPFRQNLFYSNQNDFKSSWKSFINSNDSINVKFNIDSHIIQKIIYTIIMSFSLCYDLWQPASRKTPGTYFEIVMGSILSLILPTSKRSKHISISDQQFPKCQDTSSVLNVATDTVFTLASGIGIVIPTKITTRERIVQPFAHQRILDSAYGKGRFISLILCVSETQRDDQNEGVNEICVPGAIELYQTYLANIHGIYYLDTPNRYTKLETQGLIRVQSIGYLLSQEMGVITISKK